ncbi:minor capsid protein [Lactococcus phage 62503]|uniref:Minor capsid protein n=1 Tax=Lactococcus phage 62503 TaxID=1868853 RepID=A0A1P8BLD7_9CAUD|nr:minor head protein [Lactococcus phage 62503]ANT43680.1 minor capsid protein [Lactococcus phage 62503]
MDEKQQALKNFKKALKAGMPDSEKDLANLSNDLASFYRKYLKDLKVQLKTWLELYDKMSFSEQLQVERLLNVANVINNLIGELGINVRQSIKAHIVKQGTDAYNSVWYELEQSNNILLDFDVLDPHYLETIMEQPVAGKRLSKRLEDNVNQLAKASNNAISRGFMQGKAYADIARDISTETQASYKRAVRIARTESGRVSSISTQKAYKEATGKGIDLKKMWLATLDGHTREDHQHVDGQIREVDKMFQVGGYDALGPHQVGVPSEDINCRCTTRPIVHGIMPTVRRNNITGKVGEWKSYDDWLKEQGKKNSGETDDSLGKVSNEYTDIKSIKKYIDSIDINTASHENLISIGSLVNSKFDVASKLGDKQALKDIFSNFREIGGTVPKDGWEKGSSKETKTRINDAFAFYPKEWAEYAHQNGKTIFTKKLDRGFFSEAGLKGKTWKSGVVDNGVSIMISDNATASFHEIGHYVEHFNPNAMRLSKEFLSYRTKGEEEQPIRNSIYYYNVRERTKKDNFITPYIGKTYSNATEVFSTGLECLFEPGNGKVFSHESRISEVVRKKISDDPEYLNFVIGMILKG